MRQLVTSEVMSIFATSSGPSLSSFDYQSTGLVGKLSAMGCRTRPTQPSIPPGWV